MNKYLIQALAAIFLLPLLTGCFGADREPGSPGYGGGEGVERGVISLGGVYTNDFAGITFSATEFWIYAGDEEIAEALESGSAVFGDDKDELPNDEPGTVIYDMILLSLIGPESVIVMFDHDGGAALSVRAYIDALSMRLKNVRPLTYKALGADEVELGGKSYARLSAAIPDHGVYQDYLIRREGSYIICIVLTTENEDPHGFFYEHFS